MCRILDLSHIFDLLKLLQLSPDLREKYLKNGLFFVQGCLHIFPQHRVPRTNNRGCKKCFGQMCKDACTSGEKSRGNVHSLCTFIRKTSIFADSRYRDTPLILVGTNIMDSVQHNCYRAVYPPKGEKIHRSTIQQ